MRALAFLSGLDLHISVPKVRQRAVEKQAGSNSPKNSRLVVGGFARDPASYRRFIFALILLDPVADLPQDEELSKKIVTEEWSSPKNKERSDRLSALGVQQRYYRSCARDSTGERGREKSTLFIPAK